MKKSTFGVTGLSVSPLGWGAAPIGFLATEQKQVEIIVQTMLDAGINFIDTAASYQGSEEAVGKALGSRRGECVLVSKCGQQFPDLEGPAWSSQAIAAAIDRSLRRLRTDRIDVVLLHSCGMEALQRGEAVGALMRARDAGKIRFAGYSGDNQEAAFAARLPGISVIETSVSICDQANLAAVLPIARERGLGVIAKRPIANAAWRPAQEFHGIYRDYAKPYCERFAAMNLAARDLGFASEGDWPEIALRFTLSQPGVHVAIVGTTQPANARRNLEAAARGPLPNNALEILQSAFARAEAASRQKWPGLT